MDGHFSNCNCVKYRINTMRHILCIFVFCNSDSYFIFQSQHPLKKNKTTFQRLENCGLGFKDQKHYFMNQNRSKIIYFQITFYFNNKNLLCALLILSFGHEAKKKQQGIYLWISYLLSMINAGELK